METNHDDKVLMRTQLSVLGMGALLCLFSLVLFGSTAWFSTAVGVAIASLNLLVLSKTVQHMVQGGGGSWAVIAGVKFLVLLGVTYLLIDSRLVTPLGLALGFGALPFGILVGSALGSSPRQPELVSHTKASATFKD